MVSGSRLCFQVHGKILSSAPTFNVHWSWEKIHMWMWTQNLDLFFKKYQGQIQRTVAWLHPASFLTTLQEQQAGITPGTLSPPASKRLLPPPPNAFSSCSEAHPPHPPPLHFHPATAAAPTDPRVGDTPEPLVPPNVPCKPGSRHRGTNQPATTTTVLV